MGKHLQHGRANHKPRRFVAGVIFVLIGTAFLLESLGVWSVRLVWFWPLVLIAMGTSAILGKRQREAVEEDRSASLAVAEERVRIARELHDIVAHSVSLMTVQIAAARRVFRKQPDEAEQALKAAEETGRHSLAELRRMLAILRGADESIAAGSLRDPIEEEFAAGRAPLPGLEDIESLVSSLADAGLDVNLDVQGEPPPTPGGVALAIYRVVQEALTNSMRHAGRSQVTVSLYYDPEYIDVRIEDEGVGTSAPRAVGTEGHGIMGMRERVTSVGGILYAGPRRPGPGWQVHARVPLRAAA